MSRDAKRLLIAGGGTGGHVFPALAVAREWLRREGAGAPEGSSEPASVSGRDSTPQGERGVVFVGTKHGIEARLVPQAGLPFEPIRVAGLKGIGGGKLLRNAAMLPVGLWDSERILRRRRFNAALGVGGYASGPMILLALLHGIPSVIFEPNVEPGFTNRVLARLATRVAVAHSQTASQLGRRAVVTGCPVRQEFFAVPPKPHGRPFTILITGGSQGAAPINRAVLGALGQFAARKNQLFVVHQTGNVTIMRFVRRMRSTKYTRRWWPLSRIWRKGLPRQT